MDDAVIGFYLPAQEYFENFDSEKMLSTDNNFPQTYTKTTDNVDVAINGFPILTQNTERIVPLCFVTKVADSFTFTATNLADFDANISVYLEDIQLNVIQNLRLLNTYSFSSGIATNTTRFKLHFITPVTIQLMNWLGTTSTDWDEASNWNTNTVPTANSNVYISDIAALQPHITNFQASPSVCNSLTIYNGAVLTIDAGKALTAGGTTSLNGTECLIIKSEGSFKDNGISYVGSGSAKVEKDLTDGRWWYIGSPLSSSNTASAAFGALGVTPGVGKRLYYYTEGSNGTYTAAADGYDLSTTNLQGFVFRNYSGVTNVNFIGELNTGTKARTDLSRSGTAFQGYNLICNPYPSALDLGIDDDQDGITTSGIAVSNLVTTVWYKNGSGFCTYNWTSGTGQGSPVIGQQFVPSMQAFWVRVSSGTGSFTIPNIARTHSSLAFYKTTSTSNIFRMDISDGTLTDEVVVGFYPNASSILENYDSEKMFSDNNNAPQLYSLTSDNNQVAINGFPVIGSNETRVVPVGFMSNVAGTFVLNATNLNEFDGSIPVYLEDMAAGTMQDLRQNAAYSFTSGAINTTNRFRLHFGAMTTGVDETANGSTLIYAFGKTIYVNTLESNSIIEIYDILGQKVASATSVSGINSLQSNFESGIYLVKVLSTGIVISKKIVLKD